MDGIIMISGDLEEIARQGERDWDKVGFPFGDLQEKYPGGVATLLIQRMGDAQPYLSQTTEMQNDVLVWTPTAYDTQNNGYLKAQVVYSLGDHTGKSKIYRLHIDRSLTFTEAPPPDWEDWVDDLLSAAADVHNEIEAAEQTLAEAVETSTTAAANAAQDARDAYDSMTAAAWYEHEAEQFYDKSEANAYKAEGYAVGEYDGSPVAPESQYHNNNAKYYAEQAGAAEQHATAMVTTMTAEAHEVDPDGTMTAELDYSGSHPVLRLGLKKGDTGSSGVWVGTSAPTDASYTVWIDPTGGPNMSYANGVSF